jgi:SPP1 family predicted phage head-tail adaptor
MSPALLPIGRLDRIIEIQEATISQGAEYGEPLQTWATVAQVWANVYHGGGREFEAARQVNAEIDTQFQIRWLAGVTPTMRILYDDAVFDIYRVDEVGRKERLNIWAKARKE